jgi:hypothetical protein
MDLSAKTWNPMIRHVSDRIVETIKYLEKQVGAAGYRPGTEPPNPDIRFMLYTIRPIDEWRFMARTDPEHVMDEIRDFANIARRRNQPEAAVEAARAVLSELAPQGVPKG